MTAEFLPTLNHSVATAGIRAERMPRENRVYAEGSGVFRCPGPELNWRHVDFQSRYPFLTKRRDTCRTRAFSRPETLGFLLTLNRFFCWPAFAGFVELVAAPSALGALPPARPPVKARTRPYTARKSAARGGQ